MSKNKHEIHKYLVTLDTTTTNGFSVNSFYGWLEMCISAWVSSKSQSHVTIEEVKDVKK